MSSTNIARSCLDEVEEEFDAEAIEPASSFQEQNPRNLGEFWVNYGSDTIWKIVKSEKSH